MIYNKDKKEGWFFIKIIFSIFIISLMFNIINFKTDYVKIKPGPLYQINYDDEKIYNESLGSYNMSTIAVKRLSGIDYIISYMNNDIDIYPLEKNENNDNKIAMLSAKEVAAFVSESIIQGVAPNIELAISDIVDSSNASRLNLQIGDIIKKIDGVSITSYQELIENLKNGAYSLEIFRDNQIIIINETIVNPDEKLGVKLYPIGKTNINIDKIDTDNVSGASGGLIFTLVLLDHFTDGDLSTGKKISGSGTINLDGSIGAIDGVYYKYKAAINGDIDLFFVSRKNYETIEKMENKKTKIIPVDNILQVIEYLCNIGSNSKLCGKI
jgi:PDZ domain-containing protein